jgi:uncharacterized protein with ATP-grasp and redox domains
MPELATNVHRLVKRVTGNADPYSQLKDKYTSTALELYPKLDAIIEASEDTLLTAAKLAIAGNNRFWSKDGYQLRKRHREHVK